MNEYAPYTGFGDDRSTAVKFTVLYDGDQVPEWSGGPRLVQRRIPGGNRVNIRTTGRDPYIITLRLSFDTVDALDALDALQGTVATLRYPWGVTRSVGGHYDLIAGGHYLVIPGVRLMAIDDPVVDVSECEARVTFLKEATS